MHDGRGYWVTGGAGGDAFPWNVTGRPAISLRPPRHRRVPSSAGKTLRSSDLYFGAVPASQEDRGVLTCPSAN
jgi:hypothetical protein